METNDRLHTPRTASSHARLLWSAGLFACLALPGVAEAQVRTWTVTSGLWQTPGNWSASTVPTSAATAVFSSVANETSSLNADAAVGALTFSNAGTKSITSDSATARTLTIGTTGVTINAGAGAVTLGNAGSPLNVAISGGQSWTNNTGTANRFTVLGGITSSATSGTQTLTVTGTGATLFSGNLSNGSSGGTLALVKSGNGTLTLSGNNTYTGTTTSSAGMLALTQRQSLYGANTASWTSSLLRITGGTLALNMGGTGEFTDPDVQTLTTGSMFSGGASTWLALDTSNATGPVTFSGNINNTNAGTNISFAKLGAGTLIVAGTIGTTSSSRTVASGTLQIGTATTAGSLGSVSTLNNGTIVFEAQQAAMGVTISGTGQVIKKGNTQLNISSDQTYTGLTTIESGTLRLSDGSASNGWLAGDVSNSGLLVIRRNATKEFVGNISGTGAVQTDGVLGGNIVFTGSSSYTGGTTIQNGRLTIGNGGTTGSIVGNVVNSGTLGFNRSDAISFSGTISGAGGLLKQAGNTLTLSAANTYTGTTSISQGTVRVGVANALPSTSAVSLTADGSLDVANSTSSGALTLGGTGSIFGGGTLTASSYTFSNTTGTATASAILAGAAATLTKSGAGTAVLSALNIYGGATNVSAGVLEFTSIANTGTANASALGAPAAGANSIIALFNDATLRYTGTGGHSSNRTINLATTSAGMATLDASGSGGVSLGSITAAANNNKTLLLTGTSLFDNSIGAVSNPSSAVTSLLKQGSGRWVLTATSAYTGSTTVDQGELVLGVNQSGPGAGALGNGGALTVANASGSGTAALLLKSGVQIDSRTLTIPAVSSGSQVVILGGADSSGTATFGNDGSMTVSVGRDVTLQAATGGTVVFNNAWSNATGRNVTIGTAGNAGTVRFDGSANGLTTTGTVFVNVGTLSAGAGGLPGPTALIVTSTLSAVDYNSSAPLTVNSAGRATISGAGLSLAAVTNNNTAADSVDFTDNTGTITLASLTGAGSTRFRGGASIGGTLSQGTVTIDGVGTLQTVSGGTLGLGGSSASITTLSGGRVNLSNGVALSVQSGSFTDSITGNGTLTKTTSGKLTLAGSNSYTGATAVSAGTLAVDGSIASAVTVASTAILGGSGRIAANIGGDGLIAPGNSPGILQVDGQVIPTSLTAFAFEFTSTGSPNWANATASVNDVLRLTNATPFQSGLTSTNVVNVYFDVTSLTNGDTFLGGFFSDKTSGQLDFAGAIGSPAYAFYVLGDGGGSATSYNGKNYYTLSQYDPSLTSAEVTVVNAGTANFANGTVTNGQVTQFVVVPEPATLALAAIGIGLGGWAAVRRRK